MFHIAHLLENLALSLAHVGRRISAAEAAGIGEGGGYQGTLLTAQCGSSPVEVFTGYGFYTIDARSHLYGIQIDFHDTSLVPHPFYQQGEVRLESLACPGGMRPEECVLGSLLADGAAPSASLAFLGFLASLLDGLEVKAIVLGEELVLAGNDGNGHIGRDAVQRYPVMAALQGFSLAVLFPGPDAHEWGVVHGHVAVEINNKDCAPKEKEHNP